MADIWISIFNWYPNSYKNVFDLTAYIGWYELMDGSKIKKLDNIQTTVKRKKKKYMLMESAPHVKSSKILAKSFWLS